jgi:hypothetical protein
MAAVKCVCGQYYVIITTLMKDYAEKIIATLVIEGYDIKPAAQTGVAFSANKAGTCYVIALGVKRVKPHEISKTDPECDQSVISDAVKEILTKLNVYYHSLVVCAQQESKLCWAPGNISYKKTENTGTGGPYRSKPDLHIVK